jgi:hypothetical protein
MRGMGLLSLGTGGWGRGTKKHRTAWAAGAIRSINFVGIIRFNPIRQEKNARAIQRISASGSRCFRSGKPSLLRDLWTRRGEEHDAARIGHARRELARKILYVYTLTRAEVAMDRVNADNRALAARDQASD